MKLYIAVLDDCPDHMVPTVVAHAVLGAHLKFSAEQPDTYWGGTEPAHPQYHSWLKDSFKKVVIRVNQKEFDKVAALPYCYLGYESTILEGRNCCAIPLPVRRDEELPNVLKFARMWKPKVDGQ